MRIRIEVRFQYAYYVLHTYGYYKIISEMEALRNDQAVSRMAGCKTHWFYY